MSEVTRLVLTNLDATVVFTQTQRNAILNEYHSHDLRINVISHGCEDRRIYREYGEELKYELGLEADPVIIMLGYIWNGKGAEELIKAMKYIVKESPKALLLVAGPLHFGSNYDYINRLYQLATKENVRPNVRIVVRMLSKEEMYRYSASADVAFIARKTRALSASGLYHIAVSTLTPVIAFEEPVMKEHTTAGGGILLKSLSPSHIAERILAFLDDSNLRKSQAKKMSEYLGKNLWSDLASQYVGLYGEALSSTHTN